MAEKIVDFKIKTSSGFDILQPKTVISAVVGLSSALSTINNNLVATGVVDDTSITPSAGDYILLADADNSYRIRRGPSLSTTHENKFLRQDGSWETVSLEWQPVYGAFSTNGTSIDVLSGKAALPAQGYEYKVVMVATTPDKDVSEPTIQLNGVTGASYSYMWSRTQSTAADTAVETHTSDTTGASAIYTGCSLHTFAGAGAGSRTVVRLEFTITPIVGHSDGYFSFTVQGTCSSLFTGTAATAGSAMSDFVGTLYGYNTSSSISSILITHNMGAGMPDQASVYVYRRYKGF